MRSVHSLPVVEAGFLSELNRLGFTDEADQYVEWLSGLLTNKNEDGSLQIMYTIHGAKDMEELELSHLDGHKGQKPVRVGNGAASHLQLDIYGELLCDRLAHLALPAADCDSLNQRCDLSQPKILETSSVSPFPS